jgi:hypothetical protein
LPQVAAPKIISHLADGGGWRSSVVSPISSASRHRDISKIRFVRSASSSILLLPVAATLAIIASDLLSLVLVPNRVTGKLRPVFAIEGSDSYMTALLKRLRKLEAFAAPKTSEVASWPAREAAVKQCAIGRMSSADESVVKEILALGNMAEQDELIARDPAVWERFTESFRWAVREVPAPYVMCVSDLRGEW